MNINSALANLDPANDAHWTAGGTPRMDVLQVLTQNPDLKRSDVTNAQPDFNRDFALAAETPEPAEESHVATSTEPESETTTPEEVMVEAVDPNFPQDGGEHDVTENALVAEVATPGEVVLPVTPPTQVEALQAKLADLTLEMTEAQKVADAAKKKANSLSDQVNSINRRLDVLVRTDPHHSTSGIRAYLKSQNDIREKKAARRKRFLEQSGGVDPKDMVAALELRVPLDRAMHGRKAARGAQRPVVRAPNG